MLNLYHDLTALLYQLGILVLTLAVGAAILGLAWWLGRQESFAAALVKVAGRLRFSSGRLSRRRAALLQEPFPPEWLEYLQRNVRIYSRLTPAEQQKLRDDLRILVAEKEWEGCAGQEITDEVKVTIAALAAVLLLGREHDYYAHVTSILVYPSSFLISAEDHGGHDGVIEEDEEMLGQAWYRGPVILAWDDVLAGGRGERPGQNLVYHEFAHQLDFAGDWGRASGRRMSWATWQKVMTREYQRLVRAARDGRPTLLDHYGAKNPAEFFAVATECFFEQPAVMKEQQPKLYRVLQDFYGQDPAERMSEQPPRSGE